MHITLTAIVLGLIASSSAAYSGPYLFWGHEKVLDLQPRALVEASEQEFSTLFKEVKAIVFFVRNSTNRLDGAKYPKLQQLVKQNAWSYLPQHSLVAEPFNYNANIEVINLSGSGVEEDLEIITAYNDALSIYGKGEVLGILANREDDGHFLAKREAKELEEEMQTTTAQTPTSDETDESFIYVAVGKKAILYVNTAPILNISNAREQIKLVEHSKQITFDNQKAKGYGRLNIIYNVDGDKLFVRFNFTLSSGSWYMKAVEVEYKDYKTIIPVVGNIYDIPSAPLGFSYRCASRNLLFTNGNDSLLLADYQVQPWLNGASEFGDVYDCVGFVTSPILAGLLVTCFLCGILSIGLIALLDIKTPNRFESSRSKQLTFTVQE